MERWCVLCLAACSLETEPLAGESIGGPIEEQVEIAAGGDVVTGLSFAPGGCDTARTAVLAGAPDLSAVLPGDVLVDDDLRAHEITAIDDATDRLTIEGTCVAAIQASALVAIQRPALRVLGGNTALGTRAPEGMLHVRETGATGRVAVFEGNGAEADRRATILVRNTDPASASGRIAFFDRDGAARWEVLTDVAANDGQTFAIRDSVAQRSRLSIDAAGRIEVDGPISFTDFASISSQRGSSNSYTNLFLGGAITYRGNGMYRTHGDGGSNYWAAIKMDNVAANTGAIRFLTSASNGPQGYDLPEAALGSYQRLLVNNGGITVTGNVTYSGALIQSSSRALKRDVRALAHHTAAAALAALRPVRFRYKHDPSDEHLGFIAEDVPALVATGAREGVDPNDLAALLTAVVQDQRRQLASQQREIDALEARLARLEASMARAR